MLEGADTMGWRLFHRAGADRRAFLRGRIFLKISEHIQAGHATVLCSTYVLPCRRFPERMRMIAANRLLSPCMFAVSPTPNVIFNTTCGLPWL
jgi:hypothetical protein